MFLKLDMLISLIVIKYVYVRLAHNKSNTGLAVQIYIHVRSFVTFH